MLQTILFLTILNSIGFGYCIFRELKETYVICKKEVYDAMADYYLQYHDEQGNELTHELAGGTGTPYYGFFQDYLEEEEEEENNE